VSYIVQSIYGGLLTTFLNALGAMPVFFMKKVDQRVIDIGLGFASGVMITASFTSLIIPGIKVGGILPVVIGIILGSAMIRFIDKIIPHLHSIIGFEGKSTSRLKTIWLFAIAVTLHNIPEGLAVGVGFGSYFITEAWALAIAIGLQNIPEGLSVAFSLRSIEHINRRKAFLISFLSGVVEFPLSLLGVFTVSVMHQILPYAMGFAAGAMLFVVSDEMIPESHRVGHEKIASYGLISGLIVMLILDVILS